MTAAQRNILVCCDTGCKSRGAYDVAAALEQAIAVHPAVDAEVVCSVKQTGCHGLCEQGPVVRIMPDDIAYYRVKPADAESIIEALYQLDGNGEAGVVEKLLYRMPDKTHVRHQADSPFMPRSARSRCATWA